MADDVVVQRYHCERGGFDLRAVATGHVLQVLAIAPSTDAEARRADVAEASPFAVRRSGPGTWLIVGDAALSEEDIAAREAALGDGVYIIDQTHGRARFEIGGAGAQRKLATEVAIDLDEPVFPEGASADTLFGHIAAHLTRVGPDRFEILVGASFAESLWRQLAHSAASPPGMIA